MQATLSHVSNLYRHYTHLVYQSLLDEQTHPLLKIAFQVELHTLQQQGNIVEFVLVQLLKKDSATLGWPDAMGDKGRHQDI